MPHKQAMVFKYLRPLFTFFDTWVGGSHSNQNSPSQIDVEHMDTEEKPTTMYGSPDKIRSSMSEKVICIQFFQIWSVINHFMQINAPTTDKLNDSTPQYGLDFSNDLQRKGSQTR